MADKTVQDWMAVQSQGELAVEEREIVEDLAGSIDLGVLAFSKVIADMGPFLGPEEDLIVVARALALLPAILRAMQTELASRQDVHALVEYLCARLQNEDSIPTYHAGLKQVADSLSVLASWTTFPPGDASLVAQSVFRLAQGQSSVFVSQKPDTRSALYALISFLFQNFRRPLERDLGLPSLINGVADLAELEKNPSCLKILFLLYAHVSQEWDLQSTESDKVWELFVRYFPITLGGTASDPNKPSPEELKELLLKCFTSSDKYAQDAFTLLLSSLDTDQAANKKKEIMYTMHECTTSYSSPIILKHTQEIWSALKYEIWNGESEDFIIEALRILKGLFGSLGKQTGDLDENALATLVSDVSNEIYDKMSDNRHFLKGCGRILRAISSSSCQIFNLVTRAIMPKLDVLAQTVELPLEKRSLLSVFNNILQARLDLDDPLLQVSLTSKDNLDDISIDAFLKFRQSFVDIYFETMSKVEHGSATGTAFGTSAMEGLALLAKIPNFLSLTEKTMIMEKINAVLLSTRREEDTHEAALRAVQDMSSRNPTIFKDITLPKFMELLPERLSTDQEHRKSQTTELVSLLQDLIFVSCNTVAEIHEVSATNSQQHNFDACMEKLLQLWHALITQNGQLEYGNAILAAIFRGLEFFDSAISRSDVETQGMNGGRYSHIVLSLYSRVLTLKQYEKMNTTNGGPHYIGLVEKLSLDETSVHLIGNIATLALRSEFIHLGEGDNFFLSWNEQHSTSAIWTLFCPEAEGVDILQQDLETGPEDKCLVNFLSVSLIAGTPTKNKANLKIRVGDTALAMLLNAVSTENGSSKLSRTSMLWFLQLLVNKFGALDEALANEPRTLVQIMVDLVNSSSSKSDREIDNIYRTLAYFTSATVAAHKPQSSTLLDLMMKGISNPRNGRKVAQSFRVILAPSEVMNEQNFCFLRKLRKQRVFSLAAIPLIDLWRASEAKESKENALLAFAGLLAYMEPVTLKENATSIIPVLLEGTNVQNDDWAKHAFIQAILNLLPLCPNVFENHLDSLINRMTDRTHNTYDSPSDSSVRCRAAALDVLALLVQHMPPPLLIRRKAKLMSELNVALDDCSYTVRNRADKCKMAWFNLVD